MTPILDRGTMSFKPSSGYAASWPKQLAKDFDVPVRFQALKREHGQLADIELIKAGLRKLFQAL